MYVCIYIYIHVGQWASSAASEPARRGGRAGAEVIGARPARPPSTPFQGLSKYRQKC